MAQTRAEQAIDTRFTDAIRKHTNGWTCVMMPGSGDFFGTRKAVKVSGTIDDQHEFQATLLPMGDGTHMVPIKEALRKAIKKDVGDEITVHLNTRYT